MKRYRAILLFGPPGCGKGTQGRALGTLPGFFHCACGDVFRALDPQTEQGRTFLEYADQGRLVPDEITLQLWLAYLNNCVATQSFNPTTDCLVLDGIPRTTRQAELINDALEIEHVFHLTAVADEEIARRLKRRRLEDHRPDDASEETVMRRLNVYRTESAALLNHYPAPIITTINASQPAPAVLRDLLLALTGRGATAAKQPTTYG